MPSTMTTDFDEDDLVEKKEEEEVMMDGVRLALENRREVIIVFL